MEIHMKAIVPLGLLVALSSQAGAATVCPSTGSGPVTCTDPDSSFSVTYNPSEAGLFGTMVLSNNSILFTPDAFSANSNSSNFTTETFNLTLTATVAGFDFGSFSLTERGDYMLNGNSASVQAFGEMRVRYGETDPPFDEFRSDFLYEAQGDLGFGEWDGSTVIDSSTMTQMGNTWVGTDGMVGRQVFLGLQNNLFATADAGDFAFIQKKTEMVLIEVGQTPVPVPAAAWLFASALLSLAGYRKAKK